MIIKIIILGSLSLWLNRKTTSKSYSENLQGLTMPELQTLEHENNSDTNCSCCTWNGLQNFFFFKRLKEFEIGWRTETFKTTVLLRSTQILKRAFESWRDLLSLKLQWKNISYPFLKNSSGIKRYYDGIYSWKIYNAYNEQMKNRKRQKLSNNKNKIQIRLLAENENFIYLGILPADNINQM